MPLPEYRISEKAPQGLNLRSKPIVKLTTMIAVLPMGHMVTKKADSSVPDWWEVSTIIDGTPVDGFVNSKFLTPASTFVLPPAVNNISPVHLSTSQKVARDNSNRRAYPLNEAGQPTRSATAISAVKGQALTSIIKWLNVEKKQRYTPTSSSTYCNIYAYDYCYLAGVYLPRVWWKSVALEKLKKGKPVSAVYAQTVEELNANSLFNWLKDFGAVFSWKRAFKLTTAQNAANNGQVVIICAQNKDLGRSGHICPIVPETTAQKAIRDGNEVTNPLQSQAGRNNRQYQTQTWWTSSTFREWGVWINNA